MTAPRLHRAESYEALWNQVDFGSLELPPEFNLGVACVDVHDPAARALTVVAPERSSRDYTFGDLAEHAAQLSGALAALGIGRGDVVGVVNPASLHTGVSFLALWRMGAIALPISSLFGPDGLRYRLTDSGAKVVITSAAKVPAVREALEGRDVPLIVIEGAADGPAEQTWNDALAGQPAQFEPVTTRPEDPALLVYTSGTTGNAKGALHAHRVVLGHLTGFQVVFEFFPQPSDVIWSPADWAWMAGVMDILVPTWFYGLPVVVDEERQFSAERAVWLLREFEITLTLLPATALRVIRGADLDPGNFALRVVASGGEAVGADLLGWSEKFFDCGVNEGFGQTEMNVCIGNCFSVYPVRPGSLGRALPGTTVAVLDDDGHPVIDQVGELAVDRHHPNTMLRYWNKPEATAEKFLGDWLLTGDLCCMDNDGYVWFESRKDDVFKSSGYRIGPGEIEECLGSHPAVTMSGVIGVPHPRRGHIPKAFVVLRPGHQPGDEMADALRAHVRARLAAHEVPDEIVFLDDLPRTVTGKILRRELRNP
jgi:acetyl-CoA synthetase